MCLIIKNLFIFFLVIKKKKILANVSVVNSPKVSFLTKNASCLGTWYYRLYQCMYKWEVEFVYDLLNAQRISTLNSLEHEISSDRERVCLIFADSICNTNFAVALASAIKDETYSYADFLHFHSIKLKE